VIARPDPFFLPNSALVEMPVNDTVTFSPYFLMLASFEFMYNAKYNLTQKV